ncbi:MAG: head decoration protein, partial [Bradyrhizobium sp.]|nr:head decoration protein [Bradyrhizobium sp.]
VDATAADKAAVYHARDAEVKGLALTWPAGISAPNKTAAIAALAALGIIVR